MNADDSKGWLETSQRSLKDASSAQGEAFDERLLAFIREVDARYQNNAHVPDDEQIPLSEFELLIEGVQEVLQSTTSERLYTQLNALPESTFKRSDLIEAARSRRRNLLDQSIDATPGDPEAYRARGELRFDEQDDEGAAADFARTLELDAGNVRARRGAILVALRGDRHPEALAQLDELLESHPDDELALFERARLRLRWHHIPEALVDLERLVTVAGPGEALRFAARQFIAVGRPADAAAAARRMPDDVEALVTLGKAQLDLGETTSSITTLERALAQPRIDESVQTLVSAKVTALQLLGDAHYRAGNLGPALERYLEAMALIGYTYELSRAVAKIAWQTRPGAVSERPAPVKPGDSEFPRGWIEPNMDAEFTDGKPTIVRFHQIGTVPLLERLPWVDTVEHLIVAPGAADDREAIAALLRLPLPRLRHLEIHAEHFGWSGAKGLSKAPFLSQLESLSFDECDLDAPSLQLLVRCAPRGLRSLRVFTADAREHLSRAKTLASDLRGWEMPELESLSFISCHLAASEVEALLEAKLPKLATLSLGGNDLKSIILDKVLSNPMVKRLQVIHLNDTGVPAALLTALKNATA